MKNNNNKNDEKQKEQKTNDESTEGKEADKQRPPNSWYIPEGALPSNLEDHQGVLIYYYDKAHEKHRKVHWYLERARIELQRENLYDSTKWESYVKKHMI